MRILLVGQAAFAEQVLEGLEAAGHEIAGVVCPPDRGDKPDPVKAAAVDARHRRAPVPVAQDARGAGRRSQGADADLARPRLRHADRPRVAAPAPAPDGDLLPSVAAAALPRRQRDPLAAHPRRDAHRASRSSGPTPASTRARSCCSARRPIGPDDTAGTLYYQTLFPLGVQVVLDSVELIARRPRAARAAGRGAGDATIRS